ncbi:MAG: 50S ribosomal protein L15 [Gammaproteobacteria bacterium]|nr:50S ribosomal protein L15 [Gammaproteobacteria bacterium]
MRLNSLSPAAGSKPAGKRRGRGIGSGLGKTGGRGGKGQTARQGGSVKPGFEGGQMPIQRRLPKFGFTSQKSLEFQEVRLGELAKVAAEVIDLAALKASGVIKKDTKFAKVVLSGTISRAVTLKGIPATKGAKAAIEAAGGKVEE